MHVALAGFVVAPPPRGRVADAGPRAAAISARATKITTLKKTA